jgi:hypothetical protein
MTHDLTPRWARAHPNFLAADMPAAIPTAWLEVSESGGDCPRFEAGFDVTIWIDRADPAQRAERTNPRFLLILEQDHAFLETEEFAILVACVAAILAMPRPAAEARAKIVPDAYAAHDAARAAETPSGA